MFFCLNTYATNNVYYTESPSQRYSIHPGKKIIFFDGKEIFKLQANDHWRFSCFSGAGDRSGTMGYLNGTRVIPNNFCSSFIDGKSIQYAAWKVVLNDKVFFILNNGPGGSSANISYKALMFENGKYVGSTESFLGGEYFRFYADRECVMLYGSGFITLSGECNRPKRALFTATKIENSDLSITFSQGLIFVNNLNLKMVTVPLNSINQLLPFDDWGLILYEAIDNGVFIAIPGQVHLENDPMCCPSKFTLYINKKTLTPHSFKMNKSDR